MVTPVDGARGQQIARRSAKVGDRVKDGDIRGEDAVLLCEPSPRRSSNSTDDQCVVILASYGPKTQLPTRASDKIHNDDYVWFTYDPNVRCTRFLVNGNGTSGAVSYLEIR